MEMGPLISKKAISSICMLMYMVDTLLHNRVCDWKYSEGSIREYAWNYGQRRV